MIAGATCVILEIVEACVGLIIEAYKDSQENIWEAWESLDA